MGRDNSVAAAVEAVAKLTHHRPCTWAATVSAGHPRSAVGTENGAAGADAVAAAAAADRTDSAFAVAVAS